VIVIDLVLAVFHARPEGYSRQRDGLPPRIVSAVSRRSAPPQLRDAPPLGWRGSSPSSLLKAAARIPVQNVGVLVLSRCPPILEQPPARALTEPARMRLDHPGLLRISRENVELAVPWRVDHARAN